MKSVSLSPAHYAFKWPTKDVVRTPAELTKLGAEFAALPEGRAKEDLLLEILQCFHGYLLKYVSMILRGHLPLQRNGRSKEVNKDTHLLLRCFIPREQASNRATLGAACRTLHLAFKGMDADEVYDQLMICLVKAIKRYDPHYSNKVKATVEVLDGVLKPRKKFTTSEVSSHLGQDAASYLRVLVKRGYLLSGVGTVRGESQYQRSELWPVPDSLFANGAVGLSYVALQMVPVLSGRFHPEPDERDRGEEGRGPAVYLARFDGKCRRSAVDLRPRHPEYPGQSGKSPDRPLGGGRSESDRNAGRYRPHDSDLGQCRVERGAQGPLEADRHLLYCVFVREMDSFIATTFRVSGRQAKPWYTATIEQLEAKVGILPKKWPKSVEEEAA
jgi:hypothetical protein